MNYCNITVGIFLQPLLYQQTTMAKSRVASPGRVGIETYILELGKFSVVVNNTFGHTYKVGWSSSKKSVLNKLIVY